MSADDFITVRTLMKTEAYIRKTDISAIEPIYNLNVLAGSYIHLRGGARIDVKELPHLLFERIK